MGKKIIVISVVLIGLFLLLGLSFITVQPDVFSRREVKAETKQADPEDIYNLFECPCCGEPIDECGCGMAQERIAYIDDLAGSGSSEDEVILAYIQKYGLNSFMDESKQAEFREKLVAEAPADRPIIFLSPESYDFGDVSLKKGTAEYSFLLENKGKTDLTINRIETSCGCTSGSIVFQGQEGPIFNMPGHGINESIEGWQVAIPPGEKAELKVYYNPEVHPDFRGAAIREISVFSNDPIDFQKSVQIELNQVD